MKPKFSDLTKEQQGNFGNGCGPSIKILQIRDLMFTADCRHHDFNYARGGTRFDRFKADSDFLIAMLNDIQILNAPLKVKKKNTRRALMYYFAVRTFGWMAFKYGYYRTIDEIYRGV